MKRNPIPTNNNNKIKLKSTQIRWQESYLIITFKKLKKQQNTLKPESTSETSPKPKYSSTNDLPNMPTNT